MPDVAGCKSNLFFVYVNVYRFAENVYDFLLSDHCLLINAMPCLFSFSPSSGFLIPQYASISVNVQFPPASDRLRADRLRV